MSSQTDPRRDYIPPNVLIWFELLRQIKAVWPQLDESLQRSDAQRFPDGSVYIAGRGNVLQMHRLLLPHRTAVRVRENPHFRPLKCFNVPPTEYYQLLTTDEYFESIGGEELLLVAPTPTGDPLPGETHPDRLSVCVRFWGGLERASRPKFVQAMVGWADSVGTQGIFGEGPAFLFLESLLFDRRRALFQIDVSRSGQQTVNWLTLSILNHAARGDYVSRVSYGNMEDAEDW